MKKHTQEIVSKSISRYTAFPSHCCRSYKRITFIRRNLANIHHSHILLIKLQQEQHICNVQQNIYMQFEHILCQLAQQNA